MMHQRVEGRVKFACENCGLGVATKGALVSHRRMCEAVGRLEDGRRECGRCGARVSYANFARHERLCRAETRGSSSCQHCRWGEAGRGGAGGSGDKRRGGEARGVDGRRWVGMDVRGCVGRRVSCQFCGKMVTVRNMARHLRQSCRVWDSGGTTTAVSGEQPRMEGRDGMRGGD